MGTKPKFCGNRGETRAGGVYRLGPMVCPYCHAEIEITESTTATNYVLIPKHLKPEAK
jgi:hypothetical protein